MATAATTALQPLQLLGKRKRPTATQMATAATAALQPLQLPPSERHRRLQRREERISQLEFIELHGTTLFFQTKFNLYTTHSPGVEEQPHENTSSSDDEDYFSYLSHAPPMESTVLAENSRTQAGSQNNKRARYFAWTIRKEEEKERANRAWMLANKRANSAC
jgi:hypothetical protein